MFVPQTSFHSCLSSELWPHFGMLFKLCSLRDVKSLVCSSLNEQIFWHFDARTVIIFKEWIHKQWCDLWYEWFNMDNLPSHIGSFENYRLMPECKQHHIYCPMYHQFRGELWVNSQLTTTSLQTAIVLAVPSNNLTQSKWLYCTVVCVGTAYVHNSLQWCAVEAVVLVSIWLVSVGDGWCRLWGSRWIVALSVLWSLRPQGAVDCSMPRWPYALLSLWLRTF